MFTNKKLIYFNCVSININAFTYIPTDTRTDISIFRLASLLRTLEAEKIMLPLNLTVRQTYIRTDTRTDISIYR